MRSRIFIVSTDDRFVAPLEERLRTAYEVVIASRLEDLGPQIPLGGIVPVVVDCARVTGGVERASKITRVSKRIVPVLAVEPEALAELSIVATDGGVEFLVKPVQPAELEARLKLLHQARRKQGELEVYVAALENRLNARTEELVLSKEHTKAQFVTFVHALQRVLQARHVYTEGHSRRVAKTSVTIAKAMGVAGEALKTIELGAIFHDIGKIGIRDDVLNKPGKLTDAEYEHMKTHPQIAEQILATVEGFEGVVKIVKHEHEWWNGGGYPDRLKGDAIPLGARIVSVADAWDSMVYDRAYRAAIPRPKAVEEIARHAGTQFDPGVVEVFQTLARTSLEL